MHQSPRTRRLHNDLAALERLRSESSVFRFSTTGDPPQQYHILFLGRGLCRDRGKINFLDHHRVEIKLGASYPRSMPEIRWVSPIYHPNISEIGMVCLGGYGTHWVPSIQLDELCVMLWDMLRYHNYDIRSPYNRDAALWAAGQSTFRFPTDARSLRDLRAAQGRDGSADVKATSDSDTSPAGVNRSRLSSSSRPLADNPTPISRVLQFIERYGRGVGETPAAGAGRESVTSEAARSRPEVERIRQLIHRAGTSARVDGAVRSDVNAQPVQSRVDAEARAKTLASTGKSDHDGDQEDVIILDASPVDARVTPPRSGSNDEVIFID